MLEYMGIGEMLGGVVDDYSVVECRRGVNIVGEFQISYCYHWIPKCESIISPSNLDG